MHPTSMFERPSRCNSWTLRSAAALDGRKKLSSPDLTVHGHGRVARSSAIQRPDSSERHGVEQTARNALAALRLIGERGAQPVDRSRQRWALEPEGEPEEHRRPAAGTRYDDARKHRPIIAGPRLPFGCAAAGADAHDAFRSHPGASGAGINCSIMNQPRLSRSSRMTT